MSDQAMTAASTVLHIHQQHAGTPQTDNVDRRLADASLKVTHVQDVYRGLARICNTHNEIPRAAIVCVDGLSSAEMEFFSIVSRTHRTLDVFVYGSSRMSARIAKAIDLGAKGPATPEALRSLGPSNNASPGDNDHPSPDATPKATQPSESNRSAEDATKDDSKPPSETVRAAVDTEDEAASTEPRVPWQRYGGAPARAAPVRNPPQPEEKKNDNAPPSRPPAPEPLLTAEELRALIGDPIDAGPGETSS